MTFHKSIQDWYVKLICDNALTSGHCILIQLMNLLYADSVSESQIALNFMIQSGIVNCYIS